MYTAQHMGHFGKNAMSIFKSIEGSMPVAFFITAAFFTFVDGCRLVQQQLSALGSLDILVFISVIIIALSGVDNKSLIQQKY